MSIKLDKNNIEISQNKKTARIAGVMYLFKFHKETKNLEGGHCKTFIDSFKSN